MAPSKRQLCRFESCQGYLNYSDVAQWLERQIVNLEDAGSTPVVTAKLLLRHLVVDGTGLLIRQLNAQRRFESCRGN